MRPIPENGASGVLLASVFAVRKIAMPFLPAILLVLLTASPAVPADSAFERIGGPEAFPRPALRVAEAGGSALVARGDRLVRLGRGKPVVLRPTAPTGALRALAADPAGATWIAADAGIFLTSPEVGLLDPLELRRGAPPGRPVGLHVDGRRRLWIATDEAFGVVDAGTLEGRTFTAADGLPAPPYRGLAAADGWLLLLADGGTFRYQPDAGPRPTVAVVSANGRPWSPGLPVSFEYPESLTLTMSGSAAGGPEFRVLPSERGRFRLGSLESSTAVLERIDPGRRVVQVVAVDRDLNVSEPVAVPVDVGWPFYFRPSFVIPLGLGLAAAVLGALLLAARRFGDSGRPAYGRAALSAFLLPMLGMQLLAGLVPHARGWPFVGFAMYSKVSREGRVVGNRVLETIERDGSSVSISTWESFVAYPTQVYHPLLTRGDAAARGFVEAYNQWRGEGSGREPIAGLRIRVYRRQLTADGPVELAPMTVYQYLEEGARAAR